MSLSAREAIAVARALGKVLQVANRLGVFDSVRRAIDAAREEDPELRVLPPPESGDEENNATIDAELARLPKTRTRADDEA